MAGPIRNWCVARGVLNALNDAPQPRAGGLIYVVPANTVFLLKSVVIYNASTLPSTAQVGMQAAASGANPWLEITAIQPSKTLVWNGWLAMNPGDYLLIVTTEISQHYWVSGALLPFIPGAA